MTVVSSRKLPTVYVEHEYGSGKHFTVLEDWEDQTKLTLTSVTTTDQDSSGTTLYVTSTAPFTGCKLDGSSKVVCGGQTLTITAINAGVSLTVSAITGTIANGSAVACGFVLTCSKGQYADTVIVTGATTSSSYFRVIRAKSGERGRFDGTTGVYFAVTSAVANIICITISENYATLHDLSINCTATVANYYGVAIYASYQGDYQKIIGCSVLAQGTGTGYGCGILIQSQNAVVVNCCALWCFGSATITGGIVLHANSTTGASSAYVYNCTTILNTNGLNVVGSSGYTATMTATNCMSTHNYTLNTQTNAYATLTQLTNITTTLGASYTMLDTVPYYVCKSTAYVRSNNAGNGTTVFSDESTNIAKTVSVYGHTHHDNPKFNDSAMYFDGNGDDYLSFDTSTDWDLGTGDFTIEFWYQVDTDIVDGATQISTYNGAAPNGYMWYINGGVMIFYNKTSGALSTATAPSTSAFHHYAAVRSGNTLTVYIDGVSKNSMDVTGKSFNRGDTKFRIGRQLGATADYATKGWIDEVRIIKGLAYYTGDFTAVQSLMVDVNTVIDVGTDLSGGGGASYPFNDDIWGEERPSGSAWDVGCHEYQQPAGSAGGTTLLI